MYDDTRLRLKDVRKRRGAYGSAQRVSHELTRLRSLLPQDSAERELFELAEVSGLTYKAIAARMNVSERHVYRMRRRMIEMLDAGEGFARAAQPSTNDPNLGSIQILLRYGRYKEAAVAASRLERTGLTPEMTVELLALKAIVACELGNRTEAEDSLGRAVRMAEAVDSGVRDACKRRVTLADMHLSYHEGFYETAIEGYERALRDGASRPHEEREAASLARDFIALGIFHQEGGTPQRAIEVMDQAERILARCHDPSQADVADIHTHRAFAFASLPGRLGEARREANRALAVAESHGLAAECVWAHLLRAVLNELEQRPAEALRDAQFALDLGRAVLAGGPLVRTHFVSSRIEVFTNALDGTLDHIREARELTVNGSLLQTITDLVEARVHRAAGDAEATLESSSLAIEGFQRRRTSTHYLGEAYLARATAGSVLGLDVRDDADAAVELLSRGGWVSDQERARDLAAKAHGRTA